MHLLDIMTENFKRLGNFTASFTDGLNVIAGDNAKGKSTLLQAIEAALFGISVVPGKKENIPTWGQTKARVVLRFRVGADVYEVNRTLTTAKVTRGTDIVANGNTPATLYIEGLLGLQSRDWNLFVQSKQHEASGILTFGATALNRKVEEFAGVDLIDKVQASAQAKATHLNSVAEAKAVDAEQVKAAEIALEAAKAEKSTAVHEHEAASQTLEGLEPFSGTKPAQSAADLRDEQRAAERLGVKVDAADAAVAPAQKAYDQAKERADALKKMDSAELEAQMAEMKTLGSAAAHLVAEQAGKISARKDAHGAVTRALNALAKANDELGGLKEGFDPKAAEQGLLDALKSKETDARSAMLNCGSKAKNLRELVEGAACPTCGHAKEDHDPAKLAEELATANVELATAKTQLESAQALTEAEQRSVQFALHKLQQIKDAEIRQGEAKSALEAAELSLENSPNVTADEMEKAEKDLTQAREKYAEVLASFNALSKNNQQFDSAQRELSEALSALEGAKVAKAAWDKQWAELPEPPTDEQITALEQQHAAYEQALKAWRGTEFNLQGAVTHAKQKLTYAEKSLELAQTLVDAHAASAAEASAAEAKAKKYSRLVQFLRTKRQDYMKEVWDMVMGVASKLVRQSSQSTVTRVSNENGDFFYEEEGNMSPSPSASGAQKAMIGTSLRIALGRALYGSDSLMIFDEPTESCKEHNAASMAATLATSAKQVLLITHRETDQALAKNIINVGE